MCVISQKTFLWNYRRCLSNVSITCTILGWRHHLWWASKRISLFRIENVADRRSSFDFKCVRLQTFWLEESLRNIHLRTLLFAVISKLSCDPGRNSLLASNQTRQHHRLRLVTFKQQILSTNRTQKLSFVNITSEELNQVMPEGHSKSMKCDELVCSHHVYTKPRP